MRPIVLAVCWLVAAGLLWVIATDWLVATLVPDGPWRLAVTAIKDVALVAVAGLIVYRLLARQLAEREAVEAAYGESERGFRSLFDNNPLPVWAYDRDTLRFLEINDVALAKYGYTRDELLAMKVTDVHPWDEVPRVLEAIATPRQAREVSGIWHHRLKDGRLIEVEVQVHDLDLQGRPARLVVALDVTERRRAERRFRELVEGLKAIVWEADPKTRAFRFVGARAEALLGYPLEDWASDGDMLERCVPEADLERARAYLAAIAEGRTAIPCEVRARAADGRMVWLRIDGAAHIDEAGQVTHLRGLVADVTGERDRAERVARGEKLRALGQLSSGVAHDLNQSLALIAGYGELLQQTLRDEPEAVDRLREMADVMVRAASDGGETVRRMLTFVQSSTDAAPLPVDLPGLLQEVARLTAPRWRDASQAEGRSIDLTVEIDGDAVILGNAASLREALTNLVLNAVDALPDGGTIGLAATAREDTAIVSVSDNGVGMSDEVRARIFEPFFTTKGDRGTGLGLPTVFGIVEAHGGELTVRSEPGRGTTFELSFPRAERVAAESASEAAAEAKSRASTAGRPALPGGGRRAAARQDAEHDAAAIRTRGPDGAQRRGGTRRARGRADRPPGHRRGDGAVDERLGAGGAGASGPARACRWCWQPAGVRPSTSRWRAGGVSSGSCRSRTATPTWSGCWRWSRGTRRPKVTRTPPGRPGPSEEAERSLAGAGEAAVLSGVLQAGEVERQRPAERDQAAAEPDQ